MAAFMTIEELDARGPATPPRWLVDGWLRLGGTSIWAGKPKCGKSTLLQQLAVSVALGRNFLGRPVHQGLALYALLDGDNLGATRLRLSAMAGGSLFNGKLALADDVPFSKPEQATQHLQEMIGDKRPALVVLDTLPGFLSVESLDKFAEMRPYLRQLSRLAESLGCHIALSHHDKKRQADAASDRLNGSTAIGATVEALVSVQLATDGRQTVECAQHRYGDGFPKTQLSFDPATYRSTPFGTVEEIRSQAIQAREGDLRTELLAIVQVAGSIERDKILGELKGSASRKLSTIKSLVDEGALSVTGAGVRGDPLTYQLATQQLLEAA
jgi:hypothetical protein